MCWAPCWPTSSCRLLPTGRWRCCGPGRRGGSPGPPPHCTTLYPRLCTRLTSLLEELPGLAAAARADTVERVANNNWQINIANILFLISYPLYVCTRHFALFRMVFYCLELEHLTVMVSVYLFTDWRHDLPAGPGRPSPGRLSLHLRVFDHPGGGRAGLHSGTGAAGAGLWWGGPAGRAAAGQVGEVCRDCTALHCRAGLACASSPALDSTLAMIERAAGLRSTLTRQIRNRYYSLSANIW